MKDIILGNDDKANNLGISLIAFTLYKYWLICRNESVKRTLQNAKMFLMGELNFKIKVYSLTKIIDVETLELLMRLRDNFL